MKAKAIALSLVVIAGALVLGERVWGDVERPAGFDHARHAVVAPDAACTQCHPLARGLLGKPPGHAACFGKCHAAVAPLVKSRDPVPGDRRGFCVPCHARAALAAPRDPKAFASTRVTTGVEHAVQLGHKSHAQVACTRCHDPGRARRGAPHERCVGCHRERGEQPFAITVCARCHPPGSDRPRIVPATQIVVTSAFSHARHQPRAKACTACHADVAGTDGRTLAPPKLASCTTTGCHDGKAAFDAYARCTKCHQDEPRGEFKVARPDAEFSHTKHAAIAQQPCSSCHRLSKTGEVERGGHLACVTGCHDHEADFGAREPKICGACHDGTEPWRPLIADKLPIDTTEFGATLDHGKHGAACSSCHELTTTRTELRPPRGHRACTTAGCHAVDPKRGPAPPMTACEDCHQSGVLAAREAARLAARWSVRATFNHREHTAKVVVECVRCHVDLTSPTTLSLAPPPKATCAAAGCHDGTRAFKVTGTSCTRCHKGPPR